MGIFNHKTVQKAYSKEEKLKPLNFDDDTMMDNLTSLKKELDTMYKPSKSCKSLFDMDEDSKRWRVQSIDKEFPFSMILDFEIIENQKIILKHKSGVGEAVAGGLLFGPAGAIVGGLAGRKTDIDTVENIQIRIITASPRYPVITISRIDRDTANIIYAMLMQIVAVNEAEG